MIRRIIGLVLTLIGLGGVALSIGGIMIGHQVVDAVGVALEDTLKLTSESLDTVEETLVLAKETVHDVTTGLETVEATANDLAQTLEETRPLLTQAAAVASEDVPNSLEAVQTAIPNVAQAAAVIDDTLVALNRFRIDESFPLPLGLPPISFQYDLGIDYDPEISLNSSVLQIGDSLNGLPDRLRDLESSIGIANENLSVISQDIFTISNDLDAINGRIAEVTPLLDDYIRIVTDINDTLRQIRRRVNNQLDSTKQGITIGMAWLGLTQLAPLYLGLELLTGQRGRDDQTPAPKEETTIAEINEDSE